MNEKMRYLKLLDGRECLYFVLLILTLSSILKIYDQ